MPKTIIGKGIPLWKGNEIGQKELHFDRIHIVDPSLNKTKCGIKIDDKEIMYEGISGKEAYRICPACMLEVLFKNMLNVELIAGHQKIELEY